jgi:hypothetical protein
MKMSEIQTMGGIVPIERRSRNEINNRKQQQRNNDNDRNTNDSLWNDIVWNPMKQLFRQDINNSLSNNNKNDYVMTIGPSSQIIRSWKLSTTHEDQLNLNNDNHTTTATTTTTTTTTTIILHEMDSFISPDILWRYCNQLSIF